MGTTRSDQLCKVPCGCLFLYLEFSVLSGGFEPWFESTLRLTSVKRAPSFRISNVSENGLILFLKHNKSLTFGQKTIPQIVFYPSARSDQLCKVPCGCLFSYLEFSVLSGGFEPWFESTLRLTSVKRAPSCLNYKVFLRIY